MTAKVYHYDLGHFLAHHDPVNDPADSWHGAYRELALAWTGPRPMPVP